ncbi:alpha/beta fold hydrolase [Gordonia soli]|uniref:Putative hydrolase n=1 Tax=Gordonia soli NBRC 108243 TaxID=1223545 RepID=M0QNL3_9ACTN|nr:alpha/beta fold hydrolase [Gordonia soli]GAC70168.1 putative hydrolase [Gordonia soli NBRC 108243]
MNLSYEIVGDGPTLVLLHGVVHRREAWDPVLAELSRHRRVVTVDLPGHGRSPAMPEGDDPLQLGMEILREFLDEISDGGPIHVAGNSLGGWFALELAATGAVASATALSPAGFFVNSLDQRRAVTTFLFLRRAARLMGRHRDQILDTKIGRTIALAVFFAKPWLIDAEVAKIDSRSLLTNEIIDRGLQADFGFTTPPADARVTVAWGGRDLVLPAYEARMVHRVFPQATVRVYPGVGHVPMTDDPELVAAILLDGSRSVGHLDSDAA